jgi:hypothetical protein
MKIKSTSFLFSILTLLFFSCNTETKTLPESQSAVGEILVVADSTFMKKNVGQLFKQIFEQTEKGLPQQETKFTVRYIQPNQFNKFLKTFRNIIFISTLDDKSSGSVKIRSFYSENTLKIIKNDPSRFMLVNKDEFAKGQLVMHLFGENEALLMANLGAYKKGITEVFIKNEREHIFNKIKKAQQLQLSARIKKEFGFNITIPVHFSKATEKEGFIWYRHPGQEVDRSFFITYVPYKNVQQFNYNSFITLRDSICKTMIYGREDSNSYMLTEQYEPPVLHKINFNGNFAVESRGLWKLKNNTMGGPFLGYSMADTANNRFYYIEGFVYAPGKNKRELMREMEAVLWSFKF